MGFKLHLATAFPDHTDPQFQSTNIPPFVVPELEVSSSYFSDRLTFPPPGLARSLHYPNVPSTAAFELSATINVDRDQLRFGYSGLMGEDSLFFWASNLYRFVATIWHAQPDQQAVQCLAHCVDGRSAPTCVICRSGNITVKVCC
jgi:hypothetical protein